MAIEKIWVVTCYHQNEGLDSPSKAFKNKDKAHAEADRLNAKREGNAEESAIKWEVLEMDLH